MSMINNYQVILKKERYNSNNEYSELSLLWCFNEETEEIDEWITNLPHKSKVKVEYSFKNKALSVVWIKAFDDIDLEEYYPYDLLSADFNQYPSNSHIFLDTKEVEEFIAKSPIGSEWVLTFSLME